MNNQPRGELVPGGLAMVYGLKNCQQFNGRVVELVNFLGAGDRYVSPISGDFCAAVYFGWLCVGDIGHPNHPEDYGCAVIDPANLLPIKPSADPLEITQQMEEKV